MIKPTPQRAEAAFFILLGLTFASLFIGHALTHIVVALFFLWLLTARPRLPWIPAFWWLIGFSVWEWLSNYLGPHQGNSIEGGGISYHFILILLPLYLTAINYSKLLTYILIGAAASAILIWTQALTGVDLNNSPLRINWTDGKLFDRAPGFNGRPWETQFIHSMIFLMVLPHLNWRKSKAWLISITLLTGNILPQIRAVIVAFTTSLGIQVIFKERPTSLKSLIRKLIFIGVITVLLIGTIATLRPNFFSELQTGNGRDKIFAASIEIFNQHPHTGLGGGKYFTEHYLQAWASLGWKTDGSEPLLSIIGHTHNDALMLLVHHGWPALLLWTGFIVHCLFFVWRYGDRHDRVLFISLIAMHHIAGLSETYLDYSNTTYTVILCYGLALHGPYRRYKKLTSGKAEQT